MAKVGEGDERWIVKERADGHNCNNWHWTTKDVSGHTKKVLGEKLKETEFPPGGLLAHCRIRSAEVKGDCSVNNRKGRTFLIYEFEVKIKWEGETRDEAGAVLEATKGTMRLPDVSATEIDDPEVEFESKSRGSALSEAMRKQGVALVKASVKAIVLELQEEVRAGAAEQKPAAAGPAPLKAPTPTPIKIEAATVKAPPAAAAAARATGKAGPTPKAAGSSDDDEGGKGGDGDEAPPPPKALRSALAKLKGGSCPKALRLSNCGLHDAHLQPLIDALHSSECCLESLDLAFNRLTDAGAQLLIKALASGAATELTTLCLGGNRVSNAGMGLSQWLKTVRAPVLVDWKPQLRDAKSLCTVGTVYLNSPAQTAGLRSGDSLVAFGAVQHADFTSVAESIVPLVKASVAKPIDCVVVRLDEASGVHQVALTLTPKSWSGAGLLGCILK